MINILVTGASGQLGKTLNDVKLEYPKLDFVFLDSKQLDITDNLSIEKAFTLANFDFCINCAAYTNVEQSEKTPENAFKVNAEGVKNLALACKENNTTLIHISTDYVFDGKKSEPYTIEDTPNPINEYGKSKLAGEKYIQEILDRYYIIRTSWLYSKIHGKNFYKTILEKAKKGDLIKVTDRQIGCPTDTINLSKFILGLIINHSSKFGMFHYTDNKPLTWYGFALKILGSNKLDESTTLVKTNKYRSFAKRPKNSCLTTTLIE
ncbi:dTDP-4-dehydrorhamnose reductase [Cellulophaga baltica]|uniref:dTDP-4-dehydrorhamnose reductase n=1 Tax=Cellulophaga baltica TaxID=76594 RepID=A0A1G7FPT8_9FLAO|nr:dTDP-4-dehydrorhamnose reductase [Cellulophaga baltica]SDE77926.1 dTDP-4-dehydrorhamnose reductase [Cellulophaga baltica]